MDITQFLRNIEEAARSQINLAIAAEREALYNEVISFITMTQDYNTPAMQVYTRNMGVFRSLSPAHAQKLHMALKGYRETYARHINLTPLPEPQQDQPAPAPAVAPAQAADAGPVPKKKVS